MALRLPDVVEQHREPEHRVRPHRRQAVQDMLPDVIAVVRVVLRRLHAAVEFRQEHRRDPELRHAPQLIRVRRDEQLRQFRHDPLAADLREIRRERRGGRRRIVFHVIPELRREPDRPHDAERVLPEALFRDADRADQLPLEVFLPAEQVDEPRLLTVRHRVDREVAAPQVLLQVRRERHLPGMARVVVLPVDPVRRDLEGLPVFSDSLEHRHRAVPDAGIHGVRENAFHLLGRR